MEYALLLASFALVLALGLEAGIAAGVVLASLHFAYACVPGRESAAWGGPLSCCCGFSAWRLQGERPPPCLPRSTELVAACRAPLVAPRLHLPLPAATRACPSMHSP